MTAPALRDRASKYTAISMKEAEEIMKTIGTKMTKQFETVAVDLSLLGKVVAQVVKSSENMPPTRVSTKDGYAVIANDGKSTKTVIGVSLAGSVFDGVLQAGQCVRISTGGVVPEGATAVVMVEHTICSKLAEGDEEDEIELLEHVSDGTNIREPGSEVRQGDIIVRAGSKIGSAELGILNAFGIKEVHVFKKPSVTIISTGNELVAPSTEHVPMGMVRDSNGPQLVALFKEYGFDVIDGGRVSDDFECIKDKLSECLESSDVIVTTGGVSMGEKDNLKEVLKKLGMEIQFGRVMMKPGLPCTVATGRVKNGGEIEPSLKTVLALPGNPASAWVCSHLFALPLLRKLSGYQRTHHTQIKVRLAETIRLGDRPEYVRAYLEDLEDEDFPIAHVTGNQISSNIGSLVGAQVLLVLPMKQDNDVVRKNELVKAMLL
ncbi:CBN-MOC-1 protein [Caenorhabditis brenneri]|uniref:CBN-MOC-1 protein n=1 Tax=Caenorhabditis brenneri TaxID=135651 RepID=G0MHV4_CAEBE|nr:CBN-MOC-1 protein [Caenorhabditis brenneri]